MPSKVVNKRVKFLSEINNNLIFSRLPRVHSSGLRKKWLRWGSLGDFEQLNKEIELYQQTGGSLEKFFRKEGAVILSWALISEATVAPLRFIIEHIPPNFIKPILEQKEDPILDSFLIGESMREKYDDSNQVRLDNIVDKLELLLQIAPKYVKNLLKNNLQDPMITTGVKNSVLLAVNSAKKIGITKSNITLQP